VVGEGDVVRLRLSQLRLEHKRALFDHLVCRWRELFDVCGKARRVWLMDRGVPTEEVLEPMRESDPPLQYLVGTSKGRLTALERPLLQKPWKQARPDVREKLLAQDAELYVFAESRDRIAKERGMRRRQMKWLWARLKQRSTTKLTPDALLMKLGAAQNKTPAAWRPVTVELGSPWAGAPPSASGSTASDYARCAAVQAAICYART